MADETPTPNPASPTPPTPGEMKEILAKMAEFAQLIPQQGSGSPSNIDFLRDVPVTITAQLGHVVMPIGDILKLVPGTVVELEEAISQPIRLTVRGVAFATGEVLVVDDRFAVRIQSLLPSRSSTSPGKS
jgi:flagellar motor switch protein FliN